MGRVGEQIGWMLESRGSIELVVRIDKAQPFQEPTRRGILRMSDHAHVAEYRSSRQHADELDTSPMSLKQVIDKIADDQIGLSGPLVHHATG